MAFYLSTKNATSKTIWIDENSYYKKIIIKKLRSIFHSDDNLVENEKILDHLKKVYFELSKKEYVNEFNLYSKAIQFDEDVDDLIYKISKESINIYLNSAIEAEDEDSYLANIYILLLNLDTKNDPLCDIKVFDEYACKLVINELLKAFENGKIDTGFRSVIDLMKGDSGENANPLYLFTEDAKDEEIEHLFFINEEDSFNVFDFYKKVAKVNYKEILLSEDFKNYLFDNDFDNDDFDDFGELISTYLEESCDDLESKMESKIISSVKSDENLSRHLITVNRIKHLSFDPNGKSIFNYFKED